MSGWVPMPADGWPAMAELLTSTGRPWPQAAVVTDLRWHVDQGQPIPGRPTLGQRWSWTDRQVRALLADESQWRDPRSDAPIRRTGLVGAGRRRHTDVQPAPASASQRPASASPVTGAAGESRENVQPAPASVQPAPASVHTRGGGTPSPSPSQNERENAGARPRPPRGIEGPGSGFVAHRSPNAPTESPAAYGVALASLQRRGLTRGALPSLPPGDVVALERVLAAGWTTADVELVAAWVEHSWVAGSREIDAPFLAANRHGWRTILNDRAEVRLKAAREWDARGRAELARAPPAAPERASTFDLLRRAAQESP